MLRKLHFPQARAAAWLRRWASRGGIMKIWLVILALVLTSCASTGVVPMDKDTYMLAKRSAQVGFGPADGAKADVYREATDFCAKQNKKLETVKLEMTDSGFARSAPIPMRK
jgi:hypothetical protein